jgi:very-short-patch-repair endonuclease
MPSKHELNFLLLWRAMRGPTLEAEYRFHPTRKWRFDYAHPQTLIAIELEGGIWMRGGGRHNRASGFEKDLEKSNAACAHGWRVFRLTGRQITEPTLRAIMDCIASAKGAA